eukprot:Gb_06732 [translate_table: standard]
MIQTSGSVDLLLEKLCLEGSRKQAKYAVQAIAAMTKDSGLKAFTVLYKRLVDMLESDDHLSTVLQSLGCIGQIAMPVFETREEDVIHFICRKLLRRSSNPADVSKTEWNERSEVCLLKIYGIKALVKSYLPKKDAHLRQRVKALFGVLTKFITSGEISDDVKSSTVDKAHLRLAAAKAVLRLSRQWDSHVTPQLFHLTLRIGQDAHPHVRKEFLAKVHRYLKERSLNHKYACAFVLSIPGLTEPDLAEQVRQYLVEFIETCRRDTLLRQPSRQGDSNSYTDSPEHVLIYLVHALAHHPDFPVSDKGLRAEEFEPFYRQLHFFLSVMLHQNESRHSDPGKRSEIVNIPLIMAIFRRIKQVEDAVDKSKSENLYALCDLGILITKDLAHSQLNSGDCTRSLPLPELFYKPLEGSEGINLKVDGSSLPSCLVEIDAVRHFNAANSYQGDHLDLDQKPLKRNTHDNAYEGQSDKGDTKGQISKRTRNKRGRRMKETEYGEPKTPEILKPQLDDKSGMLHKSSGLGGFQSDGSRHPKRLESEKPSDLVQEQWKSTATEVKADQFKVAEDNVTSSVAEASVPPKRKRGRPSKETVELASAGRKQGLPEKDSSDLGSSRPKRGRPKSSGKTLDVKEETKSLEAQLQTSDMVIHDLSGALLMPSNDQLLETSKVSIHKSSKRSRKSDVEPSSEAKQLRKRKTADVVPGQLKVVEDNLISTNVEKLSAKRKRGRPSKESSELFSPVQKHGLAENVTEALGSSHRKRGRPKGSGKRSNDNGKTKVPDLAIMTTERVSDGLSGALLTPSNYQQFEVNKKSMQKLSKHHKKGLDASHGKGSKTVEKSPLVKMVSMEKITPDANSRNEHRREKKAGASPESADIKLHEDGKSPMGTPGKSLKKRSISVLDESPSGKFKKENEEAEKLVGHRIKVWWPLDEQFYVGTVDSYDPKQRKHKIIYHDGDIELLRLQKEQWEVIDGDSMHDKLVKPSVASPKSDGDKRAKKIINIDESPVIKQENSGTSSSKIRNETTSQSTGNPNDTGLLTRNFNANLSGINSLGGASVDPFVFTDDTDLPAHSNGRGRKKRGIEGNKGRRRTLSTKPTGRTVKNHKETKTEADDEKRDTRSDFGLKDSDDEPLNAWRFHKCKVH